MERIRIVNSKDPVLPGLNFLMEELYKPKYPVPPMGVEFDLPVCLPLALQAFRDYYCKKTGKPVTWSVTCTLRHGTDDFSSHKDCVDSVPGYNTYNIMRDIREEFKNWRTSELVKNVLATGCNVLIIENACLHLSWRDHKLNPHPDYNLNPPEDSDLFYIGEWIPSVTPEDKIKYPYGKNIGYA